MTSTISRDARLQYVDVSISNDNGVQVNSATNYVVSNTNFVGAYVIGTNLIVACPYTYSNLIYVRLKAMETMQNATAGNYTVRVWYYR